MKRLVAITLWAGLLAGAAQAECRFGSGGVEIDPMTLPDAVAQFAAPGGMEMLVPEDDGISYNRLLTPHETLATVAGAIYEAREDLDGDGTPERCFHLATSATCSNGVVQCLHVITDASGETILLNTATHQIAPLPWPPRNGMRFVQSTKVRSDGNLYVTIFRFDGERYEPGEAVSLGPLLPN